MLLNIQVTVIILYYSIHILYILALRPPTRGAIGLFGGASPPQTSPRLTLTAAENGTAIFGSFSLYLCHMLVIAGWRVVMPKVADALQGSEGVPDLLVAAFDFGAPGVLDNIVFTLLCVSAATALAAAPTQPHRFIRRSWRRCRILRRCQYRAFRYV